MGNGVKEEEEPPESPPTYSDIFHEAFPHYLMMGMTSEEFWDGDSWLVKDYRTAYRLRKEQENRERDELAWSNGLYMRNAMQSVYLLVNGFVPNGTQAMEYPEKPYTLQEAERKQAEKQAQTERNRKKKEEEEMQVAMAMFQASVAQFNKNFAKRQMEEKLKAIPTR